MTNRNCFFLGVTFFLVLLFTDGELRGLFSNSLQSFFIFVTRSSKKKFGEQMEPVKLSVKVVLKL